MRRLGGNNSAVFLTEHIEGTGWKKRQSSSLLLILALLSLNSHVGNRHGVYVIPIWFVCSIWAAVN
jgi:hypothetical protein